MELSRLLESVGGYMLATIGSIAGQGGFDINTKTLLHLDGNLADAVPVSPYTWFASGTAGYEAGKFGNGEFGANHIYPYLGGASMERWEDLMIVSQVNNYPKQKTLDFWFKPKYGGLIFSQYSNEEGEPLGWDVFAQMIPGINQLVFSTWGYGTNRVVLRTPVDSIVIGNWHHLAIVKETTTTKIMKIYLNGVYVGTADLYAPPYNNDSAANWPKFYSTVAVLDEIRYSTVARWTSNFTPPTGPY
jgi:hypothetical protein